MAVQLAARSGARVTAVVGSAERGAGLRELGAAEMVEGIKSAEGRFALILESAGGASFAAAIEPVAPKGTVVVFGNSSGEPTILGLADFRGAPNARVQSFSYYMSEPEGRFAEDLALLVALVPDGSLRPQIGAERPWRELTTIAQHLRERQISGKAVLLVEP